jgi:3-methyl-2-oxobutanoate hydroxymethyltransferase
MKPALTAQASTLTKSRGERIAVLTAADYPTARLLEEAGVDWILVGDSLGMVVLGYPDTTSVTLADMVHHTAAVARGACNTPIIADLPIATYATPEQALESAQQLLSAGANAVKLEGGTSHAPQIAALTHAGIPTMGHIGMLPQSVREEGGYRIKGRSPHEAERLLADALSLEHAGAFALVLELVEPETARRITESLAIPTIGIGSGPHCDGQVLVTHDLTGAFPWFRPKFAKARAQTGESIRDAAKAFVLDIKSA